jgi:hypothetical protein
MNEDIIITLIKNLKPYEGKKIKIKFDLIDFSDFLEISSFVLGII